MVVHGRSNRMIETLLAPGLDASSETPLNEQLMELLQEAILQGSIRAGDRLPASRAMASRLAVSRNTVLTAYDQLIAEGYLESRQGAGTFVSTDLPDRYLKLEQPPAPHQTTALQSIPDRPLAGMPALDQFPFALWGRLSGSLWRQATTRTLQHNDPAGYRPLREAIASYLQAARGVHATADQILITAGLQQGLRFVAESLIAPEKAIILEDPGYPGLLKTSQNLPNPVELTHVDENGACVPTNQTHPPGLLLVTPSRQFPLSHTMPLKRRLELLEWARQSNSLILEDDYDSEFRYGGRPIQSLQGLDGGNRVIYGGSFSKSLFLSLRLGYLVLPNELADRVIHHRDTTASFPAIGDQMVLTRFIEEGHFARHLRRLRTIHKDRLEIFLASARQHLGPYFNLQDTDAGLHIVGYQRDCLGTIEDAQIARLAHQAGIGAVPLSRTYTKSPPRHGLLFGFASIDSNEIDNRLKNLADKINQTTGF